MGGSSMTSDGRGNYNPNHMDSYGNMGTQSIVGGPMTIGGVSQPSAPLDVAPTPPPAVTIEPTPVSDLAPPPPPPTPESSSSAMESAANEERGRRKSKGRASTILTSSSSGSGLGDLERDSKLTRRILLGS